MKWMALVVVLAACNQEGLPGAGAVDLAAFDGAAAPIDLAREFDLANPLPDCRVVSATLSVSAPEMQIAIWLEDASGNVVDTLYVTSATAEFGIANRPGTATLYTDFKWAYGRREMVMPIWAHRRNHLYPKLVMGGECSGASVNSPTALCGMNAGPCAGDCIDTSVVYHSRVASYDAYFCDPLGGGGMCPPGEPSCTTDEMVCDQRGTMSKGAFADGWNGGANPTTFSLYPPRADLTQCAQDDSPDACGMAKLNDIAVVSQATPQANAPVAITRSVPSSILDGHYTLWIEISQESDFNASNNWPQQLDSASAWQFLGHPFLGQPSMAYAAPVTIGGVGSMSTSFTWMGYGSWDGSDGELRPPDSTITIGTPGTGAGRLAALTVSSGACQ